MKKGNIFFSLLGWGIGGTFFLIGLVSLFAISDIQSGKHYYLRMSISMICAGAILIPPIIQRLRKIVPVLDRPFWPPLISFLIFIFGTPNLPTTESSVKAETKAVPTSSVETFNTGLLIPRSMAGDKGKYYLIQVRKMGDIIYATHKRIGPDSIGYTKTEIDCKTKKMREIGYSEVSVDDIGNDPTKWFELVDGSSKSDLHKFVCKNSITWLQKEIIANNTNENHNDEAIIPENAAENENSTRQYNDDWSKSQDSWKKSEWNEMSKKAIKERLKNPESASFKNVKFHMFNETPVTCGEVNSENGFGGKNGYQRFIAAGSALTFLEEELASSREMDSAWAQICN